MSITAKPALVRAALLVVGTWAAVAAAEAQQRPTPVVVAPVEQRDLPPIFKAVATVLANRRSTVASEVGGLVKRLQAREGLRFAAGAALCELDDEPARLRLAEARAKLASLEATLAELEAGTRPETIRQRAAQVEEAQAMVDKWAFEKKRLENLAGQGQTSAKELHDAEMEYLAARQRLAAAQAAYEIAVNGPRREQIEAARANVAAQRAAVELAQRDLKKTVVVAPFNAFVVARSTEVGEYLAPGAAVCEVVDIETVTVRAEVPERVVTYATPQREVEVRVPALGLTRGVAITRRVPQADQQSHTFPVEIDLPNPGFKLLPGMFAWVYLPAGEPGRRLMVPHDALVGTGDSKRVYVVRPGPQGGQMAVPLPVRTGIETAELVEVSGPGLAAGDLVVIRGNERLFGPTPVTVQNPTSQPTTGASPD